MDTEYLGDLKHAAHCAGVTVDLFVEPIDCHVLLRDRRFHYLDWGGSGPPVLFLHGAGLTAHTWDLVCLQLRDRFRCLALDLRGHGESEWAGDLEYSIDAHSRDVAALLAELRLVGSAVVGMSFGASVAVRYAVDGGAQRALVIVDSAPKIAREGTRRIVDFLQSTAELDSIDEFVDRAMHFNPRRDPRLLRRSLLHNLMRLPNGKWTWRYDPRQFLPEVVRGRLGSARRDAWTGVERIACPTLVVRGGRSAVVSREATQALAACIPGAEWVEVPDAGHSVQGDNPGGLVERLRPFLEAALT